MYQIHAKNNFKHEEHKQVMFSVLTDHFQFSDSNNFKIGERLPDSCAGSTFAGACMALFKIPVRILVWRP